MNYFLIRYRPPRDSFLIDATDHEKGIVAEHFEYLQKLHSEKKLILAGRTNDAEIGLAILNVTDESEAEEILTNDPVIKEGVFFGSLKKFCLAIND